MFIILMLANLLLNILGLVPQIVQRITSTNEVDQRPVNEIYNRIVLEKFEIYQNTILPFSLKSVMLVKCYVNTVYLKMKQALSMLGHRSMGKVLVVW